MPLLYIIAKPYDAEIVRKAAVEAGYETEVTDGSGEVIAAIKARAPAAAVLALRLSRANATQILMQLKTDPASRHVPVVLISEADSSLTLKEALQLGADHLLLRPIDPVLLMAKIESLVEEASPRPAPVPPVREQEDPERLERFRQRLEARHRLVREGDYFSLLDLDPGAEGEDVKQAHRRILKELDRAQLPEAVAQELAAPLDETVEVVEEAYRVLSDDRLREAYRKHL